MPYGWALKEVPAGGSLEALFRYVRYGSKIEPTFGESMMQAVVMVLYGWMGWLLRQCGRASSPVAPWGEVPAVSTRGSVPNGGWMSVHPVLERLLGPPGWHVAVPAAAVCGVGQQVQREVSDRSCFRLTD